MDLEQLKEEISKSFMMNQKNDKYLKNFEELIKEGKINYSDIHKYSYILGECLGEAVNSNVVEGTLENDVLTYETAKKVIRPLMEECYELVRSVYIEGQNIINQKNGLGLKSMDALINTSAIDKHIYYSTKEGLSLIESKKLMNESIIQYNQSVYDDFVRANVNFKGSSGFLPKVIRTYEGMHREHTNHKNGGNLTDCIWCKNLEGTYEYFDVKEKGSDVWKRHEGCRCIIEYVDGKRPTKN